MSERQVHEVFTHFCGSTTSGGRAPKPELEGAKWIKLCRDCLVTGPEFTEAAADVEFARAKAQGTPGARRIGWKQFKDLLENVAKKKGIEKKMLMELIVENGAPLCGEKARTGGYCSNPSSKADAMSRLAGGKSSSAMKGPKAASPPKATGDEGDDVPSAPITGPKGLASFKAGGGMRDRPGAAAGGVRTRSPPSRAPTMRRQGSGALGASTKTGTMRRQGSGALSGSTRPGAAPQRTASTRDGPGRAASGRLRQRSPPAPATRTRSPVRDSSMRSPSPTMEKKKSAAGAAWDFVAKDESTDNHAPPARKTSAAGAAWVSVQKDTDLGVTADDLSAALAEKKAAKTSGFAVVQGFDITSGRLADDTMLEEIERQLEEEKKAEEKKEARYDRGWREANAGHIET